MVEEKKLSADKFLSQLNDFEETVQELAKNIAILKKNLTEKKEKYGQDISSWPGK